MLVLARKIGEKIILNDDIEVIVLDSNQNTVRLGINAPKNVSVYREEVYKEIKASNSGSCSSSVNSMKALQELLSAKTSTFTTSNYDVVTQKVNIQ